VYDPSSKRMPGELRANHFHAPSFYPQIENVVQVHVGQQRGTDSPNTKDNLLATYPYTDRVKTGKAQLPASAGSFFERDGTKNAQLSTFKRAEDGKGYILRLRETIDRDGLVRLCSSLFRICDPFLPMGRRKPDASCRKIRSD
jgi:alpha-mannosidase